MDASTTGTSVLHLAAGLGTGLVQAEELVERTLRMARECDDPAIFTRLTEPRARREAAAAARRLRAGRGRGLLDGVPVAWKDLFDLAGLPTTAGSRVLEAAPQAAADAPVVARLAAAGMVSIGRTNMTEFAYSGLGLNPHFGTPRNPHGRDAPRAPGGSSSGSAVAVARGLVPVGIGTDTGGSVRVPAAFCGVVGYKSSTGRYPTEGVFPLAPTLDTVGTFTRSVADAIVVDAALRGRVAPAITRAGLAGQRLIVPRNVVLDEAEPEVIANFEAALARLAAAGAVVERLAMPLLDAVQSLTATRGAITAAEAFALHAERVQGEAAARMDRRVVKRIRGGGAIATADYITLLQERRRLIAEFVATYGEGAILAFPTTPHVAPRIEPLEADDDLFARVNLKTLRNTMLGNLLDWCGVSLPSGTDAAGLPTALLLSAMPGADEALLALAWAAEDLVRGDS
jgi:aspartyl-tRNA(Asn)/glutamyl-tRNA(Gln) amidotransferase subunit A